MNVALDLAKTIENTGRGITTDNFFKSIQLADRLMGEKRTLLGTVRANKRAMPPEFLKNKNREVHENKFGFQKEKTLVSHVPNRNKAVILLSTEHHSKKVVLQEAKKPEIIMAYNATKGAVDTLDKMAVQYSCKRNTRRWPMNVFFFFSLMLLL